MRVWSREHFSLQIPEWAESCEAGSAIHNPRDGTTMSNCFFEVFRLRIVQHDQSHAEWATTTVGFRATESSVIDLSHQEGNPE